MYLYNSATHKKAEFQTHTPGRVEMYTCGPTVYHFAAHWKPAAVILWRTFLKRHSAMKATTSTVS